MGPELLSCFLNDDKHAAVELLRADPGKAGRQAVECVALLLMREDTEEVKQFVSWLMPLSAKAYAPGGVRECAASVATVWRFDPRDDGAVDFTLRFEDCAVVQQLRPIELVALISHASEQLCRLAVESAEVGP